MRRRTGQLPAALLALCVAAPASSQAAAPDDTAAVVPGAGYQASGLHRALLGDGWRGLWTTPVDAPVFGFDRYAGGVDWTERGGGNMSITLHLEERDGWREHIFRSVDKFPEQALPAEIRGTAVGWVIEDLTATFFPAAPLLVPPLADALGLLHVEPVLRVMPDDPRLEVYQDTFAGMLGTVEVQANEAPDDEPGFAGSRKIKGTEEFFNDLEESKDHRLDERKFLAARLLDFLINDPDRTRDNMRWARFGDDGDYHWEPLPIDRDWAFFDAGGPIVRVAGMVYPKLTPLGPEAPSIVTLTYSTHVLDRRLLQRLTREDFDAVARQVQRDLTDEAIEAAIARIPERWRETADAPARIRTALTGRREVLPDLAREFYDLLAGEVEIRGTDEPDRAEIERLADGRVRVRITWPDGHARAGEPFYDRTFLPSETDEVRLYLHGDDDEARVIGAGPGDIRIRVIGGGGDDRLVDEAGGAHFYDGRGDNEIVTGPGTDVSRKEWDAPEPTEGLRLGSDWVPDWGGSRGWSPTVDYGDVSGLVVGFGPTWTHYGFRRLPYHWTGAARLLYATGSGGFGAEASGDYRFENSPLALTLDARAVTFDDLRFNGLGNDSPDAGDAGLVEQDRVFVHPALTWHVGWRDREEGQSLIGREEQEESTPGLRPLVGSVGVGPAFLWTDPRPEAGSPLADTGTGGAALARAGLRATFELDWTDRDAAPRRGVRIEGAAAGWRAGDGVGGYGTADGQVAGYIPLFVGQTHLALRAGGAATIDGAPAQDAAWIGGRTTLRGYRWQRFRGDRAAYGSAELRVPLAPLNLGVRWNVGVFGLADAGRVWVDGASPGGWHTAVGGGLWLDALGNALTVAYAHGESGRLYFQFGLPY